MDGALRSYAPAEIELARYGADMDISVTNFRAHCLELIRRVERGGDTVDIKRRGSVVARLSPPPAYRGKARKPWENLRGSGELLAEAEESVLGELEFEANR